MKAYLAIVSHQDNRNRQTIEQISQILTTCGFETICIRRDVEQWGKITPPPHSLLTTTLDAIRSSQLLVIDATEADTRIGIEVGYAYAHSVPNYPVWAFLRSGILSRPTTATRMFRTARVT